MTGIKSIQDYRPLIKTNLLEVARVARWTAVLAPAVSSYCHAHTDRDRGGGLQMSLSG